MAYRPIIVAYRPIVAYPPIVAYRPFMRSCYASYNIHVSHAHDVTSLLRMLKYHTCDLSVRGLLPRWLLLCSCSVLAVSLDVYPCLLLCPSSILAVSLETYGRVSVAQVTAFSSWTLRGGG